jgi:hypothetical protein
MVTRCGVDTGWKHGRTRELRHRGIRHIDPDSRAFLLGGTRTRLRGVDTNRDNETQQPQSTYSCDQTQDFPQSHHA